MDISLQINLLVDELKKIHYLLCQCSGLPIERKENFVNINTCAR